MTQERQLPQTKTLKQQRAFDVAAQQVVEQLKNRGVDPELVNKQIDELRLLVTDKPYREILRLCSRAERTLLKNSTRSHERRLNLIEETVRIALRRHTEITAVLIKAEEAVAELDIDIEKLKLRRDGVWDTGPLADPPVVPRDEIMRPVPAPLTEIPETSEEIAELLENPIQALMDRIFPLQ